MGLFITFEGIEGSGKSTQVSLLERRLAERGRKVVSVREPGGTLLGESVRPLLLSSGEEPIGPWAELLLYEACRAQLVDRVIRPALESGATVICDRFTDSTVAYQGYGRRLDLDSIMAVNRMAAGGLCPDMTFLIDCDPATGLRRAWSRIGAGAGHREDRFEKEDISFHMRVREGFLKAAEREPARVRVMDGSAEIGTIHREICYIIDEVMGGAGL